MVSSCPSPRSSSLGGWEKLCSRGTGALAHGGQLGDRVVWQVMGELAGGWGLSPAQGESAAEEEDGPPPARALRSSLQEPCLGGVVLPSAGVRSLASAFTVSPLLLPFFFGENLKFWWAVLASFLKTVLCPPRMRVEETVSESVICVDLALLGDEGCTPGWL